MKLIKFFIVNNVIMGKFSTTSNKNVNVRKKCFFLSKVNYVSSVIIHVRNVPDLNIINARNAAKKIIDK